MSKYMKEILDKVIALLGDSHIDDLDSAVSDSLDILVDMRAVLDSEEDKLEQMMFIQNKLNSKVGLSIYDAFNLSQKERLSWIRRYGQALFVELAEVYEELDYKWWKAKEVDENKIKEELIDVLHFFLSMCLLSGMDADQVYKIYLEKNKKNFSREDWDKNKNG